MIGAGPGSATPHSGNRCVVLFPASRISSKASRKEHPVEFGNCVPPELGRVAQPISLRQFSSSLSVVTVRVPACSDAETHKQIKPTKCTLRLRIPAHST